MRPGSPFLSFFRLNRLRTSPTPVGPMVHSERHTVYAATAATTMAIQATVLNALKMYMEFSPLLDGKNETPWCAGFRCAIQALDWN